MHHIDFDADQWVTRIADNADFRDLVRRHGWARLLFSDSPLSIVLIERCRRVAIANGCDLGPRVPVDRFVFGKGEPPGRHLTKINGLPYRPKNQPWPRDGHGALMAFFAQFCFADSLDIVGKLPGEVLVIFARTKGDPTAHPTLGDIVGDTVGFAPGPVVTPSYADSLAFEWYPLGIADLVTMDEIPDSSIVFPTCYAVRHRSWDYTDDSRAVDIFRRAFPRELLAGSEVEHFMLRGLAHQPGTKIGGIPIRHSPTERQPWERFIASFAGVSFPGECPYPRVDRAQPLTLKESTTEVNSLNFYEDAWINLFLNSDATVDWEMPSWYNVRFGFDSEGGDT